jgi:hypothetical protein
MLVKLAADNRTLKQIRSKERKADEKARAAAVLSAVGRWRPRNGKGAQDDIVMTVMLWRLDADDIAGALEIARYAMTYGLTMPVGRRPTPYCWPKRWHCRAAPARQNSRSNWRTCSTPSR